MVVSSFPDDFAKFFTGLVLQPDKESEDTYNHFIFDKPKHLDYIVQYMKEKLEEDPPLFVDIYNDNGCLKVVPSPLQITIDISKWTFFGYFDLEEESEYYAINLNEKSKYYLAVIVLDEQSDYRFYPHYSKFIEFVGMLMDGCSFYKTAGKYVVNSK